MRPAPRVERIFSGPVEEFLPKQLVKVNKIHLVVIIETLLAGNSLRRSAAAISRDNDQGRSGILEEGDGLSRSLVKRGSYTLRTMGDGIPDV